jgi:hypothetical protein
MDTMLAPGALGPRSYERYGLFSGGFIFFDVAWLAMELFAATWSVATTLANCYGGGDYLMRPRFAPIATFCQRGLPVNAAEDFPRKMA